MDSDSGAQATFGPRLLFFTALAACGVAIVDYLMPDNGISGTPGVLLVVGSTALLALVARGLWRAGGRFFQRLLYVVGLVLVAGTAFAAWLLEAPTLVVLMAVAALGWVLLVLRPRPP